MENYQQISIFDLIQEKVFDPITEYAKLGSETCGWHERIKVFFQNCKNKKERVDFLKGEYGIGGFVSPKKEPYYIHSIQHNTKGNLVRYYDADLNDVEVKIGYSELVDEIERLIAKNQY